MSENEKQKKRDKMSLAEKTEILEEYYNTGSPICTKTKYKGYPVGLWDVNIRNKYRHGKYKRGIPREIEVKLRRIGVLKEPTKGTRVNEKIELIEEWNKEYPKYRVKRAGFSVIDEFRERESIKIDKLASETNLDSKELLDRYIKLCSYFEYLYERFDYLSEEEKRKGQEADLRGIFGYNHNIRFSAKKYGVNCDVIAEILDLGLNIDAAFEISKRYGLHINKIIYIFDKYGSIDNFIEAYKNGNVYVEDNYLEPNLVYAINVGKRDIPAKLEKNIFNPRGKAKNKIGDGKFINKDQILLYNADLIYDFLEELPENYKKIIEHRYCLNSTKFLTLEKIAQEFNVSRERIRQIENKTLDRLRLFIKLNSVSVVDKESVESLFSTNLIFKGDVENEKESIDIWKKYFDSKIKVKYRSVRKPKKEKKEESIKDINDRPIDDLNTMLRVKNCLKKNNIITIRDLRNLNRKQIFALHGIGPIGAEKLISALEEYLKLPEEKIFIKEKIKSDGQQDIRLLGLRTRTITFLHNFNIFTIQDLKDFNKNKAFLFKGKETKLYREAMLKLTLYESPEEYRTRIDSMYEIKKLGLCNRINNSLFNLGITSIEALRNMSEDELMAKERLGKSSVEEIIEALSKYLKVPKEEVFHSKETSISVKNLDLGKFGTILFNSGIETTEDIRRLSICELRNVKFLTEREAILIRQKVADVLNIPIEKVFYEKTDKQCEKCSVSVLNLPIDYYKKLMSNGFSTIKDFRLLSEEELHSLERFGIADTSIILKELKNYLGTDEVFYSETKAKREKLKKLAKQDAELDGKLEQAKSLKSDYQKLEDRVRNSDNLDDVTTIE